MPPTPLDRIFEDVQLNIDFSKEVTGATKLLDNVLYSNLVSSEATSSGSNTNNIAVSFAKLYTWAQDLFTFDPTGTKKIEIKSSALPTGIGNTYSFQEGSIAGSFQVKENQGSWQTIAIHNGLHAGDSTTNPTQAANVRLAKGSVSGDLDDTVELQWNNGSSWAKISSVTLGLLDSNNQIIRKYLPSYVDDVVEGYMYYALLTEEPDSFDPTKYYKIVDGKYVHGEVGDVWAANTWYDLGIYEDAAHTTKINPESGKIYVDIPTNTSYRWGGTTYVAITNPIDVFTGATSSSAGVAGIVPAPAAGDQNKFLKGDGTWANVSTTDTKVEQNISSANTDFPLLLSYYDKTSSTTTAQTVNRVASIYANPSTGNITATSFNGVTLATPGAGDANKFLTGAGVWSAISYSPTVTTGTTLGSITIGSSSQDIKVPNMVGADGTNAGAAGIVPAPVATDNTLYLRGDADYADPVEDFRGRVNADTYTLVLNCTNGNPTS